MVKNLLFITVIAGLVYYFYLCEKPSTSQTSNTDKVTKNNVLSSDDTERIAHAYRSRQSDLQVRASGKVIRILPDDTEGRRHQKFILKLSNNQTVLIAHNIDLAPKIFSLSNGDIVEFYGEYEWNSKGGVVHWTHHDPKNNHIGG